ncbi:hypothetical protein RE428_40780 [Marinobacter nanhaiticus D15-8W]|uniref:ATP-grasp domain-containing protein n=1 Tax=Marinobacter nanhaiticus D15-8W TaxID=626887 RepID=N6X4T3_9GAMM|nr:hypothetical protein [Marinobacter nanhaiticus]ENO16083.1 hypothetical protein J057_12041 [Marinobacter nanhaiticus D15-8W]BES73060.1 hypothetical protein RE428_40780 [Marinobacter nanhaiticus D15-8W]
MFISFDIFRTLSFPDTRVLKPEQMFAEKDLLRSADWVLFPEYWQLNALVHGLKCRVFPSLASYQIGHNKVEMTRAFQMLVPGNTPFTLIDANGPQEREKIWDAMPLPFVAKLPRASMGEGVWLIENRGDWLRYCECTDVLYAQEYLPIDRDLRIVIVGDRVVTAYWRHQADQGFYNNVARGGRVVYGEIPEAATELALRVARELGVDHAGFDVAMVGNHPYLFEFNRLFGNQGLQGGILRDAILDYLKREASPQDPEGPPPPQGIFPIAV